VLDFLSPLLQLHSGFQIRDGPFRRFLESRPHILVEGKRRDWLLRLLFLLFLLFLLVLVLVLVLTFPVLDAGFEIWRWCW
jgi:hypothetical protein